jgi:hypothetical protein
MHMSQLERLNKVVNTRDEILEAISSKLFDLRQLMLNHGTQLCALYDGRRADVASLLEEPASQNKASVPCLRLSSAVLGHLWKPS